MEQKTAHNKLNQIQKTCLPGYNAHYSNLRIRTAMEMEVMLDHMPLNLIIKRENYRYMYIRQV